MIPIQVRYEKENDLLAYTEHVHKTLVFMGYDFSKQEKTGEEDDNCND